MKIKQNGRKLLGRQRGRVVRVPDLKSGDPVFQVPLGPLAGFVPGSPWLNSSAALVYSQLVCLLPVGILNLLSLFQKWSACELA